MDGSSVTKDSELERQKIRNAEYLRKELGYDAEFEREKNRSVREWCQACDPNFIPPPYNWPGESKAT